VSCSLLCFHKDNYATFHALKQTTERRNYILIAGVIFLACSSKPTNLHYKVAQKENFSMNNFGPK
jgi:hypothetical protein